MPQKPLSEQTLVITGASSGIGLATARMAAAAGARLFLAARDGEALARIVDEIAATGAQANYLAIDVADEAAVQRLAEAAIARFGGFDTWVNNAGVTITGAAKDIATEDHRRLFDTNYWGIVYGSLAAARHFRTQGKAGAIVNLGSTASDVATPMAAPYVASKFAVKGFTHALRVEMLQEKLPVSVTLIKPSGTETMIFAHGKSLVGAPLYPQGQIYTPDVVARAILAAAVRPLRDVAVGSPGVIGLLTGFFAPRLSDRLLARVNPLGEPDRTKPLPAVDAIDGVPAEGRERSGQYSARGFSLTSEAQLHPGLARGALLGAGAALAALFLVRRSRRA